MMAGPNIDWDYSFPYSDGPGLTGYFEEGWSGEIRVQMTVIIPDDGQDYMFSWWQNFGGGRYDQPLSPGQNDLDFVLSDAGYQHDLIRALVFRDGGTSGVSIEIPTEPVVTEIIPLQANDDEAEAIAGEPVIINVLANDLVKGSPATLEDLAGPPTIVTQPPVGTATVNADGTITYTPPEGFTGEVEFQYMIERAEPEQGFMCVVFGESFVILSMPGDFNTYDYVVMEDQHGNWMQLRYAPWYGGWEYMDGDLIYPQLWETYTLSQGGTSIEVSDIRAGFQIVNQGSWAFTHATYPDTDMIEVSAGDNIYVADVHHETIYWVDESPPLPEPGESYPVVIRYEVEGDSFESCGVIASLSD